MVLEATMICIDNSEWMRNGDYIPSRFQAQSDAVNLICGAKTQANPENTVGILTMAGKGVRVLATPTSDLGKILACMHGLEMGGEANLAAGIQVAQLALKHRQNKHQQQRIIIFAGSPVKYDKKALETIGKKLKKNSVALDIVDFGEEDDEKPAKLEALLAAVNANDSSHIVHVPSSANALSDVLISTPVFTGDGEGGSGFVAAAAAAAASGGDTGFDFGVDPNIDPELALALRVSLEEERARQEAAAKRAAEETSRQEKGEEPSSNAEDATMEENVNVTAPEDIKKVTEEMVSGSGHSGGDVEMSEASAEDQELALALQMSMQEGTSDQSVVSKVLEDQAFVASVLASLPGVDPNDPSVKDLIASLQSQSEEQQKKDEDEQPNVHRQTPRENSVPQKMSTLIVPATIPSVSEDCEQLRKAFDGWGTNEKLIISILGHRNAAQRKLIRQTYAETYGEDLLKALDKELTHDFERAVLLWALEPAERDALLANEATKRWTSSNQVLMEIACTRSSHDLLLARQAYHARYKKSLEEDVAYHTTGDFRKLLVPLVSAYRYEGDEVNMTLAKSEAKLLHEKISKKAYNDEDLIRILTTRSKAQINATLNHYKNEFKNDIEKDLEADPKDEFLSILRATIKCLTRSEEYFEKVLRLAINKQGTDEGALTRVVTTRAEIDMKIIKDEYHKRNSVPLDHAIAKDTRGDYEDLLLALIGHGDA